jgi:predicted hotdog family 3-hydroxylacyl-ACP dehydratase
MTAALPDIQKLIPHRDPMCLVDCVLAIEDEAIAVQASVPASGPFVTPQTDPPGYVVIEMMAQTIGAWNGWQRLQHDQEPQIGYLLGTRRFRCDRMTLAPGTPLRIDARLMFSDGEMACFVCTAGEAGAAPFAEATVNVFCPAVGSEVPA